jgi:hypothetical protein
LKPNQINIDSDFTDLSKWDRYVNPNQMELSDKKFNLDAEYEKSRQDIMKINTRLFNNPLQDSSMQ